MNATAYIPFSLPAVQHAPLSSRLRLDIDLFHGDTNLGYRGSILGPYSSLHNSTSLTQLWPYQTSAVKHTPATSFSHLLSSAFCFTWRYLLRLQCSHHSPPTTPSKQNTTIPNNANVLHTSPSDIQVLPVHALQHRHLLDQNGFFSDWLV